MQNDDVDHERDLLSSIKKDLDIHPEKMIYGRDVIVNHLEMIETLYVHEDFENEWKEMHGNTVVISKRLEDSVLLENFGGAVARTYFEAAYYEE